MNPMKPMEPDENGGGPESPAPESSTPESSTPESLSNAERIIEKFGGIRPMAGKMRVPVTTVQGWKKRGVIPGNRRGDVLRAAALNDIDLDNIDPGNIDPGGPAANQNAASFPAAPQGRDSTHNDFEDDDMLPHIQAARKKAVVHGLWLSLGLVALVAAAGALLLWPAGKQVRDNAARIGALEGRVDALAAAQERAVLPADIARRIEELKEKTREIGDSVARLGERASAVPGEVGDLAARIAALQQGAQGQEQLAAAVDGLRGLVGGLEGRMDGFDAALQQAREESGALAAALEDVPRENLKAAAMLMALTQIRGALNRGAPFAEDLALLRQMAGADDPELLASIEKLAPQAESGVLTPQGLSAQLRGLAGDIAAAALKGEDVSVREKAMARLNGMLEVRKDGQLLTGTPVQARVARAQSLLDSGDVEAAIAELQGIENPDARAAALPVVDGANAALLARRVENALTALVAARIGGGVPNTAQGGADGLLRALRGPAILPAPPPALSAETPAVAPSP